MNIALCIHGYFSNKTKDDLTKTNLIHNNIIKKIPNCDIFIHSFDIKNESNILNKYTNCKKYIIESQYDFIKELSSENVTFAKSLDQKIFPHPISLFSSLSFMYSRKKAIELAINEKKKYDIIICCRFDNGIRLKSNHPSRSCNPSKLIMPQLNTIDTSYLYMSFWDHLYSGYSDHWFFSNTNNMKILAKMYDNLLEYYKINSKFDIFTKKLKNRKLRTYNNDNLRANNHTIHMFYLENNGIPRNKIKTMRFN